MDYKILDYLEGMYSRKFTDKEIVVLGEMLKGETLDTFKNKYQFVLSKKVEYFTPNKMQQLINERAEIQKWLDSVGLKSLDELYEN